MADVEVTDDVGVEQSPSTVPVYIPGIGNVGQVSVLSKVATRVICNCSVKCGVHVLMQQN